ncbi:MAG: hypothetical protein QOI58_1906 [Thermoanaerobaculia bacterium]|jgi:hypothetical protein|nr:hypothetical protein [Thermoanaerobaculia bacterium]
MPYLTATILAVTGVIVTLLYGVFRYAAHFGPALQIGDEIRLWGGYSEPPYWLHGANAAHGVVEGFLEIIGGGSVALVALQTLETSDNSRRVLLYSRFGRAWRHKGVVHIEELGNQMPLSPVVPGKTGEWVESHAQYTVVKRQDLSGR